VLERVDLRSSDAGLASLLDAPAALDGEIAGSVSAIVADVRARGDAALRELTQRFDGATIDELFVAPAEAKAALDALDPAERVALEFARDQLVSAHEAQTTPEGRHERLGVHVRELVLPVERAGLYVPGGRAAYPSTVLMTAIPALVAGVTEIALCVPPGADGRISAPTLAAAALVGVGEVYRVGGAQAIAAFAYGTESIRPVDVIVGPGNAYVTEAKRQVSGRVGIDGLAGPSEVVIVADESVRPDYVAADLLAQAEHGPGGAAVLITWSDALAAAVDQQLEAQAASASRADEIESTLATGGKIVLVRGPDDAMEVANELAPEHLQLMTSDPEALVPLVRSAGAVFCGPWAPAVIGDYVAGTNHVLPTARTARFASALRVDTFLRRVPVVSLDAEAFAGIAPHAAVLARAEGLDAHARSVTQREPW
jgi:histidinol dehydrogenase